MKFPKFHYERFIETIKSNGLIEEEFFLVKRKGWIKIEYLSSGNFFTYFKKKETRINPETKQWENDVFFRIRMKDVPEIIEPNFDSLMDLFDKWIKELN